MPTIKGGHVVKFEKPLPDEEPELACMVKEIKVEKNDTRIDISPLKLGITFSPVHPISTELVDL